MKYRFLYAIFKKWIADGVRQFLPVLMLGIGLHGAMARGAEQISASAASEKPTPMLVVQTGHSANINSLAVSPNGHLLASGSADTTIKLWDVASGKQLRTLGNHKFGVRSVTFSPDGCLLASAGDDKLIKLWDVKSGRLLNTFSGHEGYIFSVTFSADGKYLASAGSSDKTIKLWLIATGEVLHTLTVPGWDVKKVVFSPVGHNLVSISENNLIKLWDIESGTVTRELVGYGVAFSPNGRELATANMDNSISLWSVASGKKLQTLTGNKAGIMSMIFTPDGDSLMSVLADKTFNQWDMKSGKLLRSFSTYMRSITSIAYFYDGKKVVMASDDMQIKQWEMASGKEVLPDLNGDIGNWCCSSVAISPDGRTLVVGSLEGAILWDLVAGVKLTTLFGSATKSLSFSPDGNIMASAGGLQRTSELWDMSTRKVISNTAEGENVESVAISPDGITLAVSRGKVIALRDLKSANDLATLKGHISDVQAMVFSPDGHTLATGSSDQTIKLWEVATGRQTASFNTVWDAASLAFSPDGKVLASGSTDTTIKLWEVASGKELNTLTGHDFTVNTLKFSPDGQILASGSGDHTIKLWDLITGKIIRTLPGHEWFVESIQFLPDGLTLASASMDRSIRLWKISDGSALCTLYTLQKGGWVVTDPEGRFDTADLEEIKGLHWVMPDDPLTPVPLEAFMKDYYEPRLLPRILNGEKFKPVRSLMDLKRVQPEVKIVSVIPDSKDSERAVVEIQVSGARKNYERAGKKIHINTAAHDLRLFRDGQLVGYIDGQVVKQGAQPYRKTFNVHLPSVMGGKEITFSAYAFNDDRVKSITARQTYQVPATVVPKKGNAYLIHMGVNQFDNPAWNLHFAANDARLMRKSLSEKFQKAGAYQNIVSLSLISDGNEHHADKGILHAILDRLSGKAASPLLKDLAGAEQLKPATPDDLVLITFAGHGYADDSGNFYLLTQDTGPGEGKHVNNDLLKRSISSEELSNWLKDVDAGDMTLIVDACHSAASVQGNDFKPGPMGSRGLGQLSFDKGMRILAASQADGYALEDAKIKQGLLSFALVTNGIEGFEADNGPKDGKIMLDEWLRYGVSRVPSLSEEVKAGKVHVAGRDGGRGADVEVDGPEGVEAPKPAQQPALFDFTKKRRQVEVVGQ